MTAEVSAMMLASFLLASASWLIPKRITLDAIAIATLVIVAMFSPETVGWFTAAMLLTYGAMRLGDAVGSKGPITMGLVTVLLAAFVFADFSTNLFWIGVSYFTLRLIHVACEWWLGSLATPTLRDFSRYLFFLPVILVGPIHRLPNFQRQVMRRRFDWSEFLSGMERCLVGAFMAYFLGEVCVQWIRTWALIYWGYPTDFLTVWLVSAIDWINLYFVFAGLSAIALGTSCMMGLRLEENFNRPWKANNLLDFWTRWHMSLTNWSRDYAYRPVMAITRSPVLGVIAAMLVIGLWHSISAYYVLWAFWQALGIIVSRLAGRLGMLERVPLPLKRVAIFTGILGWLSLARPVIGALLELVDDTALPTI